MISSWSNGVSCKLKAIEGFNHLFQWQLDRVISALKGRAESSGSFKGVFMKRIQRHPFIQYKERCLMQKENCNILKGIIFEGLYHASTQDEALWRSPAPDHDFYSSD